VAAGTCILKQLYMTPINPLAADFYPQRVILMTPNPMRWRDQFYIKAFAEHPGLLDVQAVRGIDLLLDQYSHDVRNVAKSESLPLVDVFDAFERYGKGPGHAIDDILLAGDGSHPNQAGQYLVCRLSAAKIVELLMPGAGVRVPLSPP
jgi:hypothetical protein